MRAHGPTDKMFARCDAWLCQRRIATAAVWIWALCAVIRALAPAALAEGYAFARASDTATVTRGNLRITVLGIGKFGSREPGAVTAPETKKLLITDCFEDESYVNEGDVLIEFDKTTVMEQLQAVHKQHKEAVERATGAEKDLEILEVENQGKLRKARLNLARAWLDLESYLGRRISREEAEGLAAVELPEGEIATAGAGSGLVEIGGDLGALTGAMESVVPPDILSSDGEAYQEWRKATLRLEEARIRAAWEKEKLGKVSELVDEGFLEAIQLLYAQTQEESAAHSLEEAALARRLLARYTIPQQIKRKAHELLQAERSLQRTTLETRARSAQAEVELYEASGEVIKKERETAQLEKELASLTVRAPMTGLAMIGMGAWDEWSRTYVCVGGQPFPRMTIACVRSPFATTLVSGLTNKDLAEVREGQELAAWADVMPDIKLKGEVLRLVGFGRDGTRCRTFVSLLENDERVKQGRSAILEITTGCLEDVLMVPVSAVLRENGELVCYVVRGGGAERRRVEMGRGNLDYVEIKSGLSEGEEVQLFATGS